MPDVFDTTETRVTSSTGGQKGTKLARYDLIPARSLRLLAEHYGKGAEKYDDHNWRKGYDWSLSFAALMRHAWAFWNGEDNDAETGSPHMAAVAFHAFALLEFMHEHPDFDDRWKPDDLSSAFDARARARAHACGVCLDHTPDECETARKDEEDDDR